MAEPAAASRPLADTLRDLASFESPSDPVISLYLNLQPDQHGKDNYDSFVRKELAACAEAYPPHSEARASVERDIERIKAYLIEERSPASNGLAIFACAGRDDFFVAIPLDAAVNEHRISVGNRPRLYPLELVIERHPIHAVAFAGSHAARVFVFGHGRAIRTETVVGEKINRSKGGGWSQTRYQRRVDNLQAEHARELVDVLERVVREERVEHILLAGDDVNIPLVNAELSKELAAKVVDVLKLEAHASESDVMKAAAEAVRRHDAKTDAEVVQKVMDDYRAGGLAVVGTKQTREALTRGEVDELYLTVPESADDASATLDELVSKAHLISASVRFIEDSALLAEVAGIAASLRYRSTEPSAHKESEPI
jgi:peptide subunit release factor 1 (eRF1)